MLTPGLILRKNLIPLTLCLLAIVGISYWVPFDSHATSIYYGAHNFNGIKPRAIIGSIIYVLPIDSADINFAGNLIKLISIFFWLFFLSSYFYNLALKKNNWLIEKSFVWTFFSLTFIFATSSITYITFSSAGIIDAFPFAIVALVITSKFLTGNSQFSLVKITLITLLLLTATWAHEKSIYDIAILLVWFSFIWGIKRGLTHFVPALVLSVALIIRMSNKVTSGESAAGYFKILSNGLDFFLELCIQHLGNHHWRRINLVFVLAS